MLCAGGITTGMCMCALLTSIDMVYYQLTVYCLWCLSMGILYIFIIDIFLSLFSAFYFTTEVFMLILLKIFLCYVNLYKLI